MSFFAGNAYAGRTPPSGRLSVACQSSSEFRQRRPGAGERPISIRKGQSDSLPCRILNLYTYAPFFSTYLESLGVEDGTIVYSEYTSDAMYREGSQRGAIDPCFPAKVATAHGTLPFDGDLLDRLFGEEVRQGRIVDPLDINDVWKQPFIASTALKQWAAKCYSRIHET